MDRVACLSERAQGGTGAARPAWDRGDPAVCLGLALAAYTVLAVAQLYAFTQMAELAAHRQGWVKVLVATSACAFLLFTLVSLLRQSLLMTFAYGGAASAARRRFVGCERWPSVSILVPAHNEAKRIEAALEAIMLLDYPTIEVVVIDDGSTDDTFDRASRYAGRRSSVHLRVEKKENGGKWSALNLAFHLSSGELVVCVDADSQLAPDSLKRLACHFDDPRLGGCSGQVVVRERPTLITRLQALEYQLLNGLQRQAQSAFASVLVAPGPLAMFRRRVLEEVQRKWGQEGIPSRAPARHVVGPWEDDTFAEDADLTLNVLLTGYGVTYEPAAISRTSAPSATSGLLNQRYRWTRGSFQAALKAWRRWHESPSASRGLLLWLSMFLFESIAWPAVNLVGLLAFIAIVATFGVQAPLVIWFVALSAIDLNEAAFATRIERGDSSLLRLSLLNRVYYNVLLDVSRFYALYDELCGRKMRWS